MMKTLNEKKTLGINIYFQVAVLTLSKQNLKSDIEMIRKLSNFEIFPEIIYCIVNFKFEYISILCEIRENLCLF